MPKNPTFSGKLISLKQASEISGYHPDYLSSLIREGKIKGKRVSRDWFTTPEAVKAYLSSKRFRLLKDILFSKVRPKVIFLFSGLVILIVIAVFLIFKPPVSPQYVLGDFPTKDELKAKDLEIQPPISQKKVEVTTYPSDSLGGVEVSVKPELTLSQKETPSLFQKIKDFFEGIIR